VDRFHGIVVEEDGTGLVGRNHEGRVLFRYNRWSMDYGVYRSHRMTESEKELVLLRMQLLFEGKVDDLEERKAQTLRFLNYETDQDTYCS